MKGRKEGREEGGIYTKGRKEVGWRVGWGRFTFKQKGVVVFQTVVSGSSTCLIDQSQNSFPLPTHALLRDHACFKREKGKKEKGKKGKKRKKEMIKKRKKEMGKNEKHAPWRFDSFLAFFIIEGINLSWGLRAGAVEV
jgi:hypothetical protein